MSHRGLAAKADAILNRVASEVPGVVAMATDRSATIYAGAAGSRGIDNPNPMTTDTVLTLHSATKAITGTVCLQLVEQGLLDLDAPARRYAPDIADLMVLAGFGEGDEPILRPPRREVTTRMLLLHTAGFGYDYFNATYRRLTDNHGQPPVTDASRACLRAPLLFDPGDRWEYGLSMDWAGQVVEGVVGRRLGEVLRERVLVPLGMEDTSFSLTPAMSAKLATVHRRRPDGSITGLPPPSAEYEVEVDMGGQGLYSTAEDYLSFIRMWLNDGRGPNGAILSPGSVGRASGNGLTHQSVRPLPGVRPSVTNNYDPFPGVPMSWGMTFMINDEPAPTGRAAGSLGWIGLANLYYWIDRYHGIGGLWTTQHFPLADPVSLDAYLDFETAVYASRPLGR